MTETLDFVDVVVPILEAGTWSNYGSTPIITTKQKSGPNFASIRGNKNARVEVKNEEGSQDNIELTYDGTPILQNLAGQVSFVSTDKADRNKMKTDLVVIMKASGIPFTSPRIANNPSRRNKDRATYFFTIINC